MRVPAANVAPWSGATLILPTSQETWAYDGSARRWCTEGGGCQTFKQLGCKYPNVCAEFVEQLLRSADGLLQTSVWRAKRAAGGVTLPQVACQFRKGVAKLGCQEDVLVTHPGEGYELLPRFIAPLPSWMRQVSWNFVDLPTFRWAQELCASLRAHTWTDIPLLAGNGAEDVSRVIEKCLPSAKIVSVDLGVIEDPVTFWDTILNASDNPARDIPIDKFFRLAHAAADGAKDLIVVVSGIGAHEQNFGVPSLKRVWSELRKLTNVRHNPQATVVVVSPTSSVHLLTPAKVGSGPNLTPILVTSSDSDTLNAWLHAQLPNIPFDEMSELVTAVGGQLAAARAAIRVAARPQADRLQAIRAVHGASGRHLLGAVGVCCKAVLDGESRDSSCISAMRLTGVLDSHDADPHLALEAWCES